MEEVIAWKGAQLPLGDLLSLRSYYAMAKDQRDARRLIAHRTADLDAVFEAVENWWEDVLGALQVGEPGR